MDGLAPQVMKAFWAFDKAAVADGAIPVKYMSADPAIALWLQSWPLGAGSLSLSR
jgi:hypothetical protein